MRIDRKKLNRDGSVSREGWKRIYSGGVKPVIYSACGEDCASVTIDTNDHQRVDVMFTRAEVEAMLATFQ